MHPLVWTLWGSWCWLFLLPSKYLHGRRDRHSPSSQDSNYNMFFLPFRDLRWLFPAVVLDLSMSICTPYVHQESTNQFTHNTYSIIQIKCTYQQHNDGLERPWIVSQLVSGSVQWFSSRRWEWSYVRIKYSSIYFFTKKIQIPPRFVPECRQMFI